MPRFTIIAIIVIAAVTPCARAGSHLGPVTDIAAHQHGSYSCSQAGVLAIGTDEVRSLPQLPIRVTSLAGPLPGGLLFFAGGTPGTSGSVGSIHLPDEDSPPVHEIAKDLVYDLALSPAGNRLAAACADGRVLLLSGKDLGAKPTEVHLHTAAARALAFSPDGKWLASGGLDGVVMISAVGAPADQAPLQLLDHTAGVECLVFSPDSKQLATGSKDSKVRIHEVAGKLIRTYSGLGMENEPVAGRVPARVLSLAWNKTKLIAGTSKGTLYRLSPGDDTTTKLDRPGSEPIYSLAFGPSEDLLLGTASRLEIIKQSTL